MSNANLCVLREGIIVVLTNEHLIQVFRCAGANNGVVYLSTPITGGINLLQAAKDLLMAPAELKNEQPQIWFERVVQPNIDSAQKLASRLRQSNPTKIVIDRSEMSIDGWEQGDYNSFWHQVLGSFDTTLVLAPGWEFSRGARLEVAHCLSQHIKILDSEGHELGVDELQRMNNEALRLAELDFSEIDNIGWLLPSISLPPSEGPSAASTAFEWLVGERSYQVKKFGTALDDQHTKDGLGEDSWWWQQLMNYYHRSKILTLETPVGRQALAKFVATACGLLESVIRVYGDVPRPGVSGGEINHE